MVRVAEDGMATEDEEDDTDLLPAEMRAEPASTAEAAQHAAQVAGEVKQAEVQERTRLEEDAIGTTPKVHPSPVLAEHSLVGAACPPAENASRHNAAMPSTTS